MTMAQVLASTQPADWQPLDPENTLYLELATGRVIIQLAPAFAPRHVANVKALAREHYFDGLAIVRVQDNYVVQWGDPNAENPALARQIQHAARTLPPEFDRPLAPRFLLRACPTVMSTRPKWDSPVAFPWLVIRAAAGCGSYTATAWLAPDATMRSTAAAALNSSP